MREVLPEPELANLLATFDACGGVLNYIFLEAYTEESLETLHRAAALAGMAAIDRRLMQWAETHASTERPIEMFFKLSWDETKLTGRQISLWEFWGTDDVEPKCLGENAWSIPNVDGYKTSFFHPPYNFRGSAVERLLCFNGLNRYILGDVPERAEIFSWSTDWSNYFEAGHEWWGAFWWTIRPAGLLRFVVVGASSTD